MPRPDGRAADQLRPVSIERNATGLAAGRVLMRAGETIVLCTASVSNDVPPWMAGRGKGWVTAEYNMLPGSTSPRKPRDRQKVDGRTTEIQRLIGRCLRSVIDLEALGERSVTIDCDVLQADGGTRTASITGGFVALVEAIRSTGLDPGAVLTDTVAAVSVGLVGESPLLDLCYQEDYAARVDMNVVATGAGRFVEVQGAGEESTFTRQELDALLTLAEQGVARLAAAQREALGADWPA
ncbi:Ribonuclease PH [Pirellulimonas nuda]|uniref:Ribonuclease PH n=1 Tax=Pirellulimonas nuda TaxID=2528009 RepID=A0A518D7C4_9BACT|nr:ribonuclease PH [Pirellulimonas nuda]QDU87383.1 Ribonuclease PH [Pirellulimonas nuda]